MLQVANPFFCLLMTVYFKEFFLKFISKNNENCSKRFISSLSMSKEKSYSMIIIVYLKSLLTSKNNALIFKYKVLGEKV